MVPKVSIGEHLLQNGHKQSNSKTYNYNKSVCNVIKKKQTSWSVICNPESDVTVRMSKLIILCLFNNRNLTILYYVCLYF